MLAEWNRVYWPRRFLLVTSVLAFLAAGWILMTGLPELGRRLGQAWPLGDEARRVMLLACGALFLARLALTELLLHDRWLRWESAAWTAGGAVLAELGFALAGAGDLTPLGRPADGWGVLLVLVGGGLAGVAVRRRWHARRSEGRPGVTATRRAPRLLRHPDLLGDLVLAVGWALLTGNPLAGALPLALAAYLALVALPEAAWRRALREREGRLDGPRSVAPKLAALRGR